MLNGKTNHKKITTETSPQYYLGQVSLHLTRTTGTGVTIHLVEENLWGAGGLRKHIHN